MKHFRGGLLLSGMILVVVGIFYLGFGVDRTHFWSLFIAFSLSFSGYYLLVRKHLNEGELLGLICVGIALRITLVFAFPLLSDDLYRFLWDGYLINAGENPFTHLPAWYLEAGHEVPGLSQELFNRLNSPDYYTIYPPIAQVVFTAATWLFPNSWYGAALVMKLFLVLCELGSLWVFWQLLGARSQVRTKVKERGVLTSDDPSNDSEHQNLNVTATAAGSSEAHSDGPADRTNRRKNLLFYWLNPLIIVEITGNLHFEGAMVFFLLLAYYLLQRSRWVAGAAAFAASVASKLLPLMLLPLLIRRLWRRKPNFLAGVRPFLIFSVAFGTITLLFFLPFLLSPNFIAGFRSSLELYQQKFEFNASLYYLARAVGYWQVGWNQIATIGPSLAKAAAVGVLLMALLDRRSDWNSLASGWMWAFVLYLLCATTVHPWYLSVPIALSVFTRWRFPLVWSFLIMLTYTNYLTDPYEENLWLVGGEYVIVSITIIYELWLRRAAKHN